MSSSSRRLPWLDRWVGMLKLHFGLVKIRAKSIGWDFFEVYKCFKRRLENTFWVSPPTHTRSHVFSSMQVKFVRLTPPGKPFKHTWWTSARKSAAQPSSSCEKLAWNAVRWEGFNSKSSNAHVCFNRGVKGVWAWRVLSSGSPYLSGLNLKLVSIHMSSSHRPRNTPAVNHAVVCQCQFYCAFTAEH